MQIETKGKQAFALMPFTPKDVSDMVYLKCIKRSLEDLGWTCLRADERIDIPETVCRICKNIQESRLIVADVSGKNPNVFLEIGLSFGLEKEVMFLTQDISDLPFDVRTFHALPYSVENLSKLSADIANYIRDLRPLPEIYVETVFERRWKELKRIEEVPSKALVEVFVGATGRSMDWLSLSEENRRIVNSTPDLLMILETVGRRGVYEYRSAGEDIYFRVYSDGFFHYVGPLRATERYGKTEYYINWLVYDLAELLLFSVRVMKRKSINLQQSIRTDLHGIKGLEMGFSPRHWPTLSRRTFSAHSDTLSYQKTFLPSQEWSSFFYLLCDIYREICQDLGIIDITDEVIAQNVSSILKDMQELRTTYQGAGLRNIPLDDLIPSER